MSLSDAFRIQAINNERLGSPFTARVLGLLGARLKRGTTLTDRLFDWGGNIGASGQSVQLRLLAGLHALVLADDCPALSKVYPPNDAPDDDALWTAINTALSENSDTLNRWLDNPPQTNEVRRASVIIATGHWLASDMDCRWMCWSWEQVPGLT